jgi:hypothetical protein
MRHSLVIAIAVFSLWGGIIGCGGEDASQEGPGAIGDSLDGAAADGGAPGAPGNDATMTDASNDAVGADVSITEPPPGDAGSLDDSTTEGAAPAMDAASTNDAASSMDAAAEATLSAPRCMDDAGGCPGTLSCVGSYCLDCATLDCPTAGEALVVVGSDGGTSPVIPLATTINSVDVALAVDSTASMNGELNNLKSGISQTASQIGAIPVSVAFGLLDFEDFMTSNYVVQFDERMQTVATTDGLLALTTAVDALRPFGGGDIPEAGWEALYSITGGPPIQVTPDGGPPLLTYTSAMPASTPPVPPTTGETQGTLGGIGFREDAMPVVVSITDTEWHDAPGVDAGVPTSEDGLNDYPAGYAGVPSRQAALAALEALGARGMGIAAQGATGSGDPLAQASATASVTGAVVPVSAFSMAGTLPAGCAATQCCTGLNGAGESDSPPGSGQCPMAFACATTGTGIAAFVAEGVQLMVQYAPLDLSYRAIEEDAGAAASVVQRIDLVTDGSDPYGCVTASPATLADRFSGPTASAGADGQPDTVPAVPSRPPLCVRIVSGAPAGANGAGPRFVRFALQARGIWKGSNIPLGSPQSVVLLVPAR